MLAFRGSFTKAFTFATVLFVFKGFNYIVLTGNREVVAIAGDTGVVEVDALTSMSLCSISALLVVVLLFIWISIVLSPFSTGLVSEIPPHQLVCLE